jgi:hypothetical protein
VTEPAPGPLNRIGAGLMAVVFLLVLLHTLLFSLQTVSPDPHHLVPLTLAFGGYAILLAFGLLRVRPRPDRPRLFRFLMIPPLLQACTYLFFWAFLTIDRASPPLETNLPALGDALFTASIVLYLGGFVLAAPLFISARRAGWLLAAEFMGPGSYLVWGIAVTLT